MTLSLNNPTFVRRRESGLCPQCGLRPPEQNRSACQSCLDTDRQKRRVLTARRVAEGRCFNCENLAEPGKSRCARHLQDGARRVREAHSRLVHKVISHYGGVCHCCGESIEKFLTIDHINGGGRAHRRAISYDRAGDSFYAWLVREGFPPGFALLCYNCNCGRARNGGLCPHQIN
jgi:hypothetical protein